MSKLKQLRNILTMTKFLISKRKEIFNKLVDERLEEITSLDKKVSPDNLVYRYKGQTADVKFDEFDNAFYLIDKIIEGEISLKHRRNKKGNKKHRSKEQKKKTKKKHTLYNTEMLYRVRNNSIKFLMIIFQ